jgi:PAS domain S-box-containing protein
VESYQEELAQIKTILKNNPKGMTVTDIAREIRINRNSVAKYLDILLISGHAEMVTFGPAKVFFPSSRIPLSALLNFTNEYIVLLDSELRFLQVSENFLRFFEIQRSDVIGKTIDVFSVSFFQTPELSQNTRRALEGTEITIEKQYRITDQLVYLRIKHIPTTFDDGEPGVTLIIEDVTDWKRTEEKMKRAIKEWETTFNSISDMVFIQDNEFSILRANHSFADFLHMKTEECLGKKCYELLHGLHSAHSSCACKIIHQTKKPVIVEFYEIHLDKYLEISASPIFSDEGDVIGSVHIVKDITEQKKKEC